MPLAPNYVIPIKMHQSLTMVNIPIKTHPTHNVFIKTLVIVDILFKLTLPIIVFSMHPLKHRSISSMPCKLQKKKTFHYNLMKLSKISYKLTYKHH